MLAQRLPERDNQPRIIGGPEKVRNISDFCRCFVVMSGRSDHPSCPDLTFAGLHVSQFGWSAVSPSRPAISPSARRSGGQGKRPAARSHAQPPLCGEHGEHGEHWTLMAAATGATLDQVGCVRTSASHNPYSTSEAEAGSPSKSVTATPSIAVILLIGRLRL
jgi:hypothetical protein